MTRFKYWKKLPYTDQKLEVRVDFLFYLTLGFFWKTNFCFHFSFEILVINTTCIPGDLGFCEVFWALLKERYCMCKSTGY